MNLVTSNARKTGDRFDIGSETVELVVSVHLASLLWGRGSEMEREFKASIVPGRRHLWLTLLVTGRGGGGQWGRLDHLLLTEMAGSAGPHSSRSSQSSSSS